MNLYNEIEPYAAAWLRNLSAAGHIAPGTVDTRSIEEVQPDDVRTATQFHTFAGIGVWSYALRLAGWPDDLPVWTGSCPCQPFSQAGSGRGTDDERHLWPAWFRLIRECRPPVVFGEQVASTPGLAWFDAVRADLEDAGYAVGVADLCAAGVGAPHLRQRLYFVAYSEEAGRGAGWTSEAVDRAREPRGPCAARGLADPDHTRLEGRLVGRHGPGERAARAGGVGGGLADAGGEGRGQVRPLAGRGGGGGGAQGLDERPVYGGALDFWSDADWLPCRDGKARPVESRTFPLAHGAPARVGRLRAYGNAIVPQVAAAFVRSFLDCFDSRVFRARLAEINHPAA